MATPLRTIDPLALAEKLWPNVHFYNRQRDIIYSVVNNDETVVPAGNKLGKDFVAAFIVLWFFLTRHPCRIVTTSAKADHLRVLWGEIGDFIQKSAAPLNSNQGGPLVITHQNLRRIYGGEQCSISYTIGMVASQDTIAAMQGHHVAKTGDGIPRTLFVSDESSSVPHEYYTMAQTWANRSLIIGNTWPCANFFKYAVKGNRAANDPGGDRHSEDGKRCYRKVIRIRAQDSPNVRYALAQIAGGKQPTNEIIVPGVKDYEDYLKDRATLDKVAQAVILDAEFYEGAENLLFPPDWLTRAEQIAARLPTKRQARAIGVDPGEGVSSTSMAAVDEYGLIELVSRKTLNTSGVTSDALAFARRHNVPPERVIFDAGGGGRQHADRLAEQGFPVRTVGFGEAATALPQFGTTYADQRLDNRQHQYSYVNRRAEMYGALRILLDPANTRGFGLPACYTELRRQLAPMPLLYDGEGRMRMLPKNKRGQDSKEQTLVELIGCSPDDSDALVLAIFAMQNDPVRARAGVMR